MSVVLRHPETQQIILYCKGADSAVLPRLAYTRTFVFVALSPFVVVIIVRFVGLQFIRTYRAVRL